MDPPQEQVARQENECHKLPIRDIRMIVGVTTAFGLSKKAYKTYLRMVQNIQLTSFIPKMALVNNPIMGFLKEDV